MIRIGQGFDIHRLGAGRPFWLGGIQLDAPYGPIGHSDGDVILHALVDALLGATGQGDIGEWFPPSNNEWKDAPSHLFVQQVLSTLNQDDWQIENVDITVFLEQPKLSPYKSLIQSQLACLLGITASQVNVKAKSMEGLGPIGQNEAVASMVSALLTKS